MRLQTKALALVLIGALHSFQTQAQGTAFTYQGRVIESNAPANGIFEFEFTLRDSAGGVNNLGTLTIEEVPVTNGLFTVTLDFGAGLFNGQPRWLEIRLRNDSAGGSFVLLSPRTRLLPAPYAIMANSASNLLGNVPTTQLSGTILNASLPASPSFSGTVTANSFSGNGGGLTNLNASQLSGTIASANLSGTYSGAITLNNAANSFSGNGGGVTNLNAGQLSSGTVPDARLAVNVARTNQVWLLGGNIGTTAGTHFLGTRENQPVEFKVNGVRVLRLEPGTSTNGGPNVIGGSPYNFVGAGMVGVTIAGGGATNYLGSSYTNSVSANFGTIGGGYANTIQTGATNATIGGGGVNMVQTVADYSTIGGGYDNLIQTNAYNSTIGGGAINTIEPDAPYSMIGGGSFNTIEPGAGHSTIGGGYDNLIQTDAYFSTIGGGSTNTIEPGATSSMIGGGGNNTIYAGAYYSTIGGGSDNWIQTDAFYSTIGGGSFNTISPNAFNATIGGGTDNVISGRYGTVPGGDSSEAGTNSFAAGRRAKATHTGAFVWGDSNNSDIASTNANSVTMRASGGYRLFSNSGATLGVFLAASGNSWAMISDRNAKKNFQTVDGKVILEKLAQVPVQKWNYKSEADDDVPHIGPMAQDFKAAFYPGRDDKSITTMEFDGVALAAIQGLNQKVEEKNAEISALKRELEQLKQIVDKLANRKE